MFLLSALWIGMVISIHKNEYNLLKYNVQEYNNSDAVMVVLEVYKQFKMYYANI